VRGSILANSRQEIFTTALEEGATHVLFLDSDQMFPPYTFQRLFSRGKKVIGANIATKCIPAFPTARAKGEEVQGIPVYTAEGDEGVEQVWRLGTGVLLVDMSIFSKVEWPIPVFEQPWVGELKSFRGEDWGFMDWLDKRNIPVYVDHKLSKDIGHIGDFVYTYQAMGLDL
jgi:hypothetical protein